MQVPATGIVAIQGALLDHSNLSCHLSPLPSGVYKSYLVCNVFDS